MNALTDSGLHLIINKYFMSFKKKIGFNEMNEQIKKLFWGSQNAAVSDVLHDHSQNQSHVL